MISTVVSLVVISLCAYAFWWRSRCGRARCCIQMDNYNSLITSCGTDASFTEAWRDPEATKKLVGRLFHQKLPRCPSGGTYSMVYGQPYPSVPTLVCSLEDSCGHRSPRDDGASLSIKTKDHTSVIHLW